MKASVHEAGNVDMFEHMICPNCEAMDGFTVIKETVYHIVHHEVKDDKGKVVEPKSVSHRIADVVHCTVCDTVFIWGTAEVA